MHFSFTFVQLCWISFCLSQQTPKERHQEDYIFKRQVPHKSMFRFLFLLLPLSLTMTSNEGGVLLHFIFTFTHVEWSPYDFSMFSVSHCAYIVTVVTFIILQNKICIDLKFIFKEIWSIDFVMKKKILLKKKNPLRFIRSSIKINPLSFQYFLVSLSFVYVECRYVVSICCQGGGLIKLNIMP